MTDMSILSDDTNIVTNALRRFVALVVAWHGVSGLGTTEMVL